MRNINMVTHTSSAIDLLVVIVNFRTPRLTGQCLQSLADERRALGRRMVVCVVDNASNDDSVTQLRQMIDQHGWSAWCQLFPLSENRGFSGGNNAALRYGPNSEYVLLLNSDTVVHPTCLKTALACLDRSPDIGMVSARLMQPDGQVQTQARRFPTPGREALTTLGLPWRCPNLFRWAWSEDPAWDRSRVGGDVDWIGGAFMLLRRRMLRDIGLLDESFFFFGEDVELCLRAARAGWRRYYEPKAVITHYGGGSGNGTPIRLKPTFWDARYRLQQRCFGRAAAMLLYVTDRCAWQMRLIKSRVVSGRADENTRQLATTCQQIRQAKPVACGSVKS
jgi:GT2 family glycosyltransferase